MKRVSTLVLIAAMAAAPAFAQDAAAPAAAPAAVATPAAPAVPVVPAPDKDAAGVYQVFRTTDSQLNCEQLTAELNTLNALIKTQAETAQRNAGRSQIGRQAAGNAAGGFLAGAGRMGLARAIPGMGALGAVAAVAASDAAAQGIGNAIAKGGQPQAAATVSNEQQRLSRVMQLHTAKAC